MDAIKNKEKKTERLVELNVIEQVFNLAKIAIVQDAWTKGKKLAVHGLVYHLKTGVLHDLETTITDRTGVPNFYLMDSEMN